jgi:hypothetical protein
MREIVDRYTKYLQKKRQDERQAHWDAQKKEMESDAAQNESGEPGNPDDTGDDD